jgi:hypothetical protein
VGGRSWRCSASCWTCATSRLPSSTASSRYEHPALLIRFSSACAFIETAELQAITNPCAVLRRGIRARPQTCSACSTWPTSTPPQRHRRPTPRPRPPPPTPRSPTASLSSTSTTAPHPPRLPPHLLRSVPSSLLLLASCVLMLRALRYVFSDSKFTLLRTDCVRWCSGSGATSRAQSLHWVVECLYSHDFT